MQTAASFEGQPPWLSASCATPCACYPITARPRSSLGSGRLCRRLDAVLEISTASVDVHFDASEAVVWAQHFAFGYKHPPLTGWLFALWFAVFPRQQWAMNLLTVMTSAVALAVSWRLLRDHLDKNRALLGLFALMLIPLYDVKAEVLNANTVMIPVWAAALLFYLRARRGLGPVDAFLAGAFASLTMLGKYWAVFLFAGMAVAALVGPGVRRFWRSPAPYLMAIGAAIVLAPHVWWMADPKRRQRRIRRERRSIACRSAPHWRSRPIILWVGGLHHRPVDFLRRIAPEPRCIGGHGLAERGAADGKRGFYCWCRSCCRRWSIWRCRTGSPPRGPRPIGRCCRSFSTARSALLIDERATARGGLATLAVTLAILIASPVIACRQIDQRSRPVPAAFPQVAEIGAEPRRAAGRIDLRIEGIVSGLPFYLPQAKPLMVGPLSAEGRAAIAAKGLLIVCIERRRRMPAERRKPFIEAGAPSKRVTLDAKLPRLFQPTGELSDHRGAAGLKQTRRQPAA